MEGEEKAGRRILGVLRVGLMMFWCAVRERKFLKAFSGMGELRHVMERGDEGRCSGGDAALAGPGAETALSEVHPAE